MSYFSDDREFIIIIIGLLFRSIKRRAPCRILYYFIFIMYTRLVIYFFFFNNNTVFYCCGGVIKTNTILCHIGIVSSSKQLNVTQQFHHVTYSMIFNDHERHFVKKNIKMCSSVFSKWIFSRLFTDFPTFLVTSGHIKRV